MQTARALSLALVLLAATARAVPGDAPPCPPDAPCAKPPVDPEAPPTPAVPEAENDDPAAPGEEEPDDDDDAPDVPSSNAEAESQTVDPAAAADPALHFTRDVSDTELATLWEKTPEKLGSISVGFADAGRMVNAVQMPTGDAWTIVAPPQAYGVQETIDQLVLALNTVAATHPGTRPVRVNHISGKDGGWLRPHQSHQTGRDVDLAFYYLDDVPPGYRGRREQLIDRARCWTLLRTLATQTDTQVVLVDRRIQKVLADYALSIGEDPAFVKSLFNDGARSMVQHARRHRDHFHIRFFAPRAQELGRRVQPLLAKRPEHNLVAHRVRRGDTLGHIAHRYGSTVALIRKANGIKGSFIRAGRVLHIPLRGPCNKCPLPPPVVVPPRRTAPALHTETPAPTTPETPPAPPPAPVVQVAAPPVP